MRSDFSFLSKIIPTAIYARRNFTSSGHFLSAYSISAVRNDDHQKKNIISFVDGNGHYRLNQPQDERSALMSASSLRIPLSHQQIPLPGTEHRERGIFDPSAEFFMFPHDNPFVLMYYCRSTSELMGGAARMSRCDCSDPSAAQAKEDAYGMGYPQ